MLHQQYIGSIMQPARFAFTQQLPGGWWMTDSPEYLIKRSE